MSISRSKKKLIVIIGSIVGVLGILAVVYFLNMDAINNWFRLKTMSDEEYADMVTDRFVDILEDRIFAPAKLTPDLSGGANLEAMCSLDESIASRIGVQRELEVTSTGTAFLDDGILGLHLDPYAGDANGNPVHFTGIDTTIDFSSGRVFVRIPEFDNSTLELTSLYIDRLGLLLSDMAPIVDVEKILDSLSDTFTGIFDEGGLFDRLRNSEKSRELTRDDTFWGIGLKEGRECSTTVSTYDLAGYEITIKVFAEEKGEVIGAELKINTGKNRLSIMLDLIPLTDGENVKDQFSATYEASLDGLKLFNGVITAVSSEDGASAETTIKAEPGKLIKSLLGGEDVFAEISVSSRKANLIVDVTADMGNGKISTVNISLGKLNASKPEILGTGEVKDISKLNIADYGDVGRLAEFVVDKVEALDLQILRDYIDAYIKEYVNAAAGYEMLREFHASGMLSRVVSVLLGGNVSGNIIPGHEARPETGNSDQTGSGNTENTGPDSEVPETDTFADTEGKTSGGENASDTEGKMSGEGNAAGTEGNTDGEETSAGTEGKTEGEEKAVGTAKEPTPEEIEKLKAEFLGRYKYSYPIETDNPKADWGDEVVMDIVPILMGMPYKDAEYKNAYAYLGEQWYGEGLDEKIIGKSIGDEVEVEATLGDDFGAFSGYHGKFRVTIKEIHKYVRPEWTESFIVDRLGYESLAECEKKLLATLD